MTQSDTVGQHGTHAGYDARHADGTAPCRPCERAQTQWASRRRRNAAAGRPHKVPGIGTERRIRALIAAGWSSQVLAGLMGVSHDQVFKWSRAGRKNVYSDRAAAVAAMYDLLQAEAPQETTGHERHAASYARRTGIRSGWLTPDQWGPEIDDPPPAVTAVTVAEKFCGCHPYMPNEWTTDGYVCMGCGWDIHYGRPDPVPHIELLTPLAEDDYTVHTPESRKDAA